MDSKFNNENNQQLLIQITDGDKVKDKLETIIPTITKFTKSTWEQAKAITEAKLQAQLAEVQFVKLNATYLKEAEVQRQIRDNVNLTFATRLAANE